MKRIYILNIGHTVGEAMVWESWWRSNAILAYKNLFMTEILKLN